MTAPQRKTYRVQRRFLVDGLGLVVEVPDAALELADHLILDWASHGEGGREEEEATKKKVVRLYSYEWETSCPRATSKENSVC